MTGGNEFSETSSFGMSEGMTGGNEFSETSSFGMSEDISGGNELNENNSVENQVIDVSEEDSIELPKNIELMSIEDTEIEKEEYDDTSLELPEFLEITDISEKSIEEDNSIDNLFIKKNMNGGNDDDTTIDLPEDIEVISFE